MCRTQNATLPDIEAERTESGITMNTRGLRSQLKDSVPVAGLCPQGQYGIQDSLRSGFTSVKNELIPSHPLEVSEKNFQLNQDKMNFSTLRNIQGLHAPLKLQMEYRAARQVHARLIASPFYFSWLFLKPVLTPHVCPPFLQIQRLPFLQSSNLALDTLRGSDESIGFDDILNGQNLLLSALTLTVVTRLCEI
uniref:Proteasome maturation protein n=1 Tax=Scophthalmus maximus TaxID=52904 RepID=A0A8D3E5K5_SCOMX